MKNMRCGLLLLAVCLIAAGPADAGQKKKKSVKPKSAVEQVKKPAVAANYGKYNFNIRTLDGKAIQLASFAGKVVLVNIWAPWCGPCKSEVPGFVKLYQEYHKKGFEVVGVAVQTNESDVRNFIQKYSLPWPNAIADSVAKVYGTYGLPDNYLFNKQGGLIKRFIGLTKEEALRPLIEEALK